MSYPAGCEINTLDQFKLDVLSKSLHEIAWWWRCSGHPCHIAAQLESGLWAAVLYNPMIFIHLSGKNSYLSARKEGRPCFV